MITKVQDKRDSTVAALSEQHKMETAALQDKMESELSLSSTN
jgi:hypothetical protein